MIKHARFALRGGRHVLRFTLTDTDGAVYDVTLAGADTAGLRGVRQFELELGEIGFAPGISSA